MRILGPEDGCKQVDVAGRRLNRQKDGTFHADGRTARQLLKSGEFTEARTRMTGRGFVCQDCGFHAVISDHCGRCDGRNLTRET